jgi:hypothetical protein
METGDGEGTDERVVGFPSLQRETAPDSGAEEEDLSSSNEAKELRRLTLERERTHYRNGGSESEESTTESLPPRRLTEEEKAARKAQKTRAKNLRQKERKRAAKAAAAKAAASTPLPAPAAPHTPKRGRSESVTPPCPPKKAPKPPQGGRGAGRGAMGAVASVGGRGRGSGAQPTHTYVGGARPKIPTSIPGAPRSSGDHPRTEPAQASAPKHGPQASGTNPGERKDKGEVKKGLTFAEIARSNLTLMVLPPEGAEGPLTSEDSRVIQMAIMKATADEPPPPQPRRFGGFVLSPESLAIRCLDETTFLWARPILAALNRGGQANRRYQVSSPRDLPPFEVFKAWVSGLGVEDNLGGLVRSLMNTNPDLRRHGSRAIQIRGRPVSILPGRICLYMEVDARLVEVLEALNYEATAGLSTVSFKRKQEPQ